ERIAINMPIQGLAADILKMAMIETANVLKKKKLWREEVSMLLTIHDELLFEVKEEKKEKVIDLIKNVMEKVFTMQVPLKVEVKEGKNWGEI
ncbi:MAG: DNA polymerase I, partial [Candidatus Liptonbacteria bacterium CG11_big_fil_rev_8_21_14_0_20_35_14]